MGGLLEETGRRRGDCQNKAIEALEPWWSSVTTIYFRSLEVRLAQRKLPKEAISRTAASAEAKAGHEKTNVHDREI
jgi:hypothetical protein